MSTGDLHCLIDIVVEESDDARGQRVKAQHRAALKPTHGKDACMVQTTNPQRLLRLVEEYEGKLEKRVKALEGYARRQRNTLQSKDCDGLPMPPWGM
jgi:hypothetical protein